MNKKEKIKELEEMIEVVLLRIPREIEAMKYYISAAKRTSSKTAKELFIRLAEEEAGHENELKTILNSLRQELEILQNT